MADTISRPRITRTEDHSYFVDGKGPYPSVTTVVDAAVGKGQMLASVRRRAIEFVYNVLPEYGGSEWPSVDYLEAAATHAALAEAELGDRVHKAIEERIRWDTEDRPANEARPAGDPWVWRDRIHSDDISDHILAFGQWENTYKPRWVASERLIFHPEYEYGGTLDALALMSLEYENELVLVDFKSGKRAWKEHILQLAAYRAALIHEGVPVDRCAIVHVRPGLKPEQMWHPIEVNDADFDAFLSCLEVYRWLNSRAEP